MRKNDDGPDRFAEFLFDMGKWFGGFKRPEIRDYFIANGVTPEELDAIAESIKPLLKVIYRDR